MSRDALEIVLRIRRVAVDEAKRGLAVALAAEGVAQRQATAAEDMIASESDNAADVNQGDASVEAFAAWLPVGRAKAKAARSALEAAGADVVLQRAALTAARAAAEAAEALLDRRRAARLLAEAAKALAVADEVGARASARNALETD